MSTTDAYCIDLYSLENILSKYTDDTYATKHRALLREPFEKGVSFLELRPESCLDMYCFGLYSLEPSVVLKVKQ